MPVDWFLETQNQSWGNQLKTSRAVPRAPHLNVVVISSDGKDIYCSEWFY